MCGLRTLSSDAMKMPMTAALLVILGFMSPAVSHLLLRRSASQQLVAQPASASTDPIVGLVDGGDYYTKAWTGENAGDRTRGTGSCTAFRRTLQCNPSGIRSPSEDKGCQGVVNADESGFCECGDNAQFAAVDCNHRPFTCEVMCLKFAVVTGKSAVYRGQNLTPAAARDLLHKVMWGDQTDLEAMRMMVTNVTDFMDRAMKHNTAASNKAKESIKTYLDMMKSAQSIDAAAAAAELAKYRAMVKDSPWLGIYKNGGIMIKAGRGIQDQVRKALPFDPVQATKDMPPPSI